MGKFLGGHILLVYSGHLYLVDHGSTDRGLTDHVDLLFQDCMTHIVNVYEHIYVYVFVSFVSVIYYDLQVHFYITG